MPGTRIAGAFTSAVIHASAVTKSTVCAAPAPVSPSFGDLKSEFGTLKVP